MQASVTRAELVTSAECEEYTLYAIEVSDGPTGGTWAVCRRFSQFDALRRSFEQQRLAPPPLSPGVLVHWVRNHPLIVSWRTRQLNGFLEGCLADAAIAATPDFLRFVGHSSTRAPFGTCARAEPLPASGRGS